MWIRLTYTMQRIGLALIRLHPEMVGPVFLMEIDQLLGSMQPLEPVELLPHASANLSISLHENTSSVMDVGVHHLADLSCRHRRLVHVL